MQSTMLNAVKLRWRALSIFSVMVIILLVIAQRMLAFRSRQLAEGRAERLSELRDSMAVVRATDHHWPQSSKEILRALSGAGVRPDERSLALQGRGIDVFTFAGRLYIYGCPLENLKDDSGIVVLMEVDSDDSEDIGFITSDGEIKFVSRTKLIGEFSHGSK